MQNLLINPQKQSFPFIGRYLPRLNNHASIITPRNHLVQEAPSYPVIMTDRKNSSIRVRVNHSPSPLDVVRNTVKNSLKSGFSTPTALTSNHSNSSIHLKPYSLQGKKSLRQSPNAKLLQQSIQDCQDLSPQSAKQSTTFSLAAHYQSSLASNSYNSQFSWKGKESQEEIAMPYFDDRTMTTNTEQKDEKLKNQVGRKQENSNQKELAYRKKNPTILEELKSKDFIESVVKRVHKQEWDSKLPENQFDEYSLITEKHKDQQVRDDSTTYLEFPKQNITAQNKPDTRLGRAGLEALGKLFLAKEFPELAQKISENVSSQRLNQISGKELSKNDAREFGEKDRSKRQRKYLQIRKGRSENSDEKTPDKITQANVKEDSFFEDSENELFNQANKFVKPVVKSNKTKLLSKLIINKRKEEKKKESRAKLCSLLWVLTYPSILEKDVKAKVNNRREEIMLTLRNQIKVCLEDSETFLVYIGQKFLRNLICETKSLELFSLAKPVPEKVLETRIDFIFTNLNSFFDKLITKTSQETLSFHLLIFLKSISQDRGVLPQDFLFDFEIMRLQFNHFGGLKNMSSAKSKMVIGSFVLLQVLVHKIIMRPWTVFPDIKESKTNKKNLLTIGSILHHSILYFYKRTVAIRHRNQDFLHTDLKINARKERLKALDEILAHDGRSLSSQKIKPSEKDCEGILGFIPQEDIKSLFCNRKKWLDQLKALIEGWHDKIYDLVQIEELQNTQGI